jgi:two-component system sensor histidine kinase AlgZ
MQMIEQVVLAPPVRSRARAPLPQSAPQTQLAFAPPAPAPRIWPLCLATLAGWSVLVLLHAFALHSDARGPDAAQLRKILLSVVPPVVTLALASCALAWGFARAGEALLRPTRLVLLGAVFCGGGLLAAASASVLANMVADGAALASFGARLRAHEGFGWWVDACLAGLALLSQAAFAFWRRGQQQQRAAEQALTDGLALRLRLLQGQLKPHFLFNALNSIGALVRTAEREKAAQALGQLSELLRRVVNASHHGWLSVADEMAFIDAYLDMQLLRYGERLSIELELGEGNWKALACPPMLFQPLVENAIHHGVEQQHRQCCLHLRLALVDGAIVFSIDNPLPSPRLRKGGHGMGHGATRERLAILYGAHAALASAADDSVYRATLTFPARGYDAA